MRIAYQIKRINQHIEQTQSNGENCRPRILIYLDMLCCMIFYGFLIEDYFNFKLWRFKACERKKFTSARRQAYLVEKTCGEYCEKLENKAKFNSTFDDYLKREWLELPGTDFETFKSFAETKKAFIVKPLCGEQGKGVRVESISNCCAEDLYNNLCAERVIVEERLTQVKELAEFNADSINTMRVVTLLCKEGARVITAAIRFGRKNQVVDNYCSGGLAASVNTEYGIVCSAAVDNSGKEHIVHPDSGKQIIGFKVPMWDEIKQTCIDAAELIPETKYVGWDVCITEDGEIAFVEGNAAPGAVLTEATDLSGKWHLYEAALKDLA